MAEEIVVWYDGEPTTVQPGSVVGRERLADVVVAHPDVSRRHAEVRRKNGTIEICDVGSTNGIWSNGARCESVVLAEGTTRITLGPKDDAPYVDISVSGSTVPPEPPRSTNGTPPEPSPAPNNHGVASSGHSRPAHLNNMELAENLGELSQVLELPSKRVLIGRSQQCDVVLQDALVSRRHAELQVTGPSSARITDLGTDNGTYVNGVRIQSTDISDGDLIELGHIQLVLRQGTLEEHIAYGLPLQAANLSVVVDNNTPILQDISFTLPAGSLTAIIGPSGSGKTTLLNALTGRRQADYGGVLLGGRNIYDKTTEASKRIGFVPQDDPVHDNLTVEQALMSAAKMRLPQGIPNEEILQHVHRVAFELGLWERLDTRVRSLSGGQRKRVSVGYELGGQPQALILDEPTSGLDPGLERELMNNLRTLANQGTTTVVVTHSVQSVELCDQVLVLAPGGRMAFVGTPQRAISYFGVPDLASVFSLLSSRPDVEWEQHFAETSSYARFVSVQRVQNPPVQSYQSSRSAGIDLWSLLIRYLRLLAGDTRRLVFLFAQAPVLGLLLSFVLSRDAFGATAGSGAREYLVAMVLAITLIGVLNSVREIVQDRPVFRREFAVGVSSTAFVFSRWIVLTVIVLFQALILVVVGSFRQESSLGDGVLLGPGMFELLVSIAGIGVASVGIGLVISAFVDDTPKALTMFPLVVIPAMLLSGIVLPTSGRLGVEQLTYVNPIQWGSSAAASVVDLPASENCDVAAVAQPASADGTTTDPAPAPVDQPEPPPSCSNGRWSRSGGSQFVNLFMQFISNIVLVVVAAFGAWRSLTLPLRR